MAHKKAAGSAKNLRDSKPKYRGVKVFGGQPVSAGNIIVRQKGNKYEAGENTYIAKDFSIHANMDGVVEFSKGNKTRFDGRKYLKTIVNVVPAQKVEPKKATTKVAPKTEEKKPAAKKTTTAKKATTAKKPAAKKTTTAAKKPAAKKTTTAKKTTK